MKIYTKKGDAGTTQLIGGTRVDKHHMRIETYGTLDELTSFLGFLHDHLVDDRDREFIMQIENDLYTLGTFIALDPEKEFLKNGSPRLSIPDLTSENIRQLEAEIDRISQQLPPLKTFVLPGGNKASSLAHICRTVARRAERRMTALHAVSPLKPVHLQYINRLSDYLFVLARKLTYDHGSQEYAWNP